jgi:hypothetical protein
VPRNLLQYILPDHRLLQEHGDISRDGRRLAGSGVRHHTLKTNCDPEYFRPFVASLKGTCKSWYLYPSCDPNDVGSADKDRMSESLLARNDSCLSRSTSGDNVLSNSIAASLYSPSRTCFGYILNMTANLG